MPKQIPLHVGICTLEPLQVVHRLCIFHGRAENHDKKIRQTFQILHEWLVQFSLDPQKLIHIGIPVLDEDVLVTYDCCIEFPLPIQEENSRVSVTTLTGGKYAVLRVEKTRAKIGRALRQFLGDYIPDHGLIPDEKRHTYEIYYETELEYCLPLIE